MKAQATLEDTSVGALALVKTDITIHGSKTQIAIHNQSESRHPLSLVLTLDTADIRRAWEEQNETD